MTWNRYFRYLDRTYRVGTLVIVGGVILFGGEINNGVKFLLFAACAFLWLLVRRYMVVRERKKSKGGQSSE